MIKKIFILLILLFSFGNLFSQIINRLEFHHSNPIILFSSVDITFEPIKNNKKGKVKVKVKKSKDEEYHLRISKEKFRDIYNACFKIKYDTAAVKGYFLDTSSTDITLTDSLGNKKFYYADGLRRRSKMINIRMTFGMPQH